MNILMLTYEVVDEGGSFIRCFSLAKNLVKLGHRVTVLASNKTPGFIERKTIRQGVVVIEIACPLPHRIRHNGTSPFQIISRAVHILRHRYDVVHGFGHRPSVFIPAHIHKLLYRRPYVADWADLWGWGGLASYRGGVIGDFLGVFDDAAERWIFSHVDGLTVISQELKKIALRRGVPEEKICLLPPGADAQIIYPQSKGASRRLLGLPAHAQILVFVGNASYDAELLARTFIKVFKHNNNALLLFAGASMPAFWNIIRRAKLEKRVIYKGFVPHDALGEVLACGDIMLLPYTNRQINTGRFPNKLGDYLAAGRPIVTNPTGDIRDIIAKEEVGLLVGESSEAFARGIRMLLHNQTLSRRFGQNARHLAETGFSWRQRAMDLHQFYTTLLSSPQIIKRFPMRRA